jgi:hypothetical protein
MYTWLEKEMKNGNGGLMNPSKCLSKRWFKNIYMSMYILCEKDLEK